MSEAESQQKPGRAAKRATMYKLRLYIAGETPRSLAAIANLKKICEKHLRGQCRIEVLDLLQNPQLALSDQILAIPTLVRTQPFSSKRIVGDLSSAEHVLVGLDLLPRQER
jgi:circadian clock protein KaiB